MSLETIKKLIWSSNMFFFGSKRIPKRDFIEWYGLMGVFLVIFIIFVGVWVI